MKSVIIPAKRRPFSLCSLTTLPWAYWKN